MSALCSWSQVFAFQHYRKIPLPSPALPPTLVTNPSSFPSATLAPSSPPPPPAPLHPAATLPDFPDSTPKLSIGRWLCACARWRTLFLFYPPSSESFFKILLFLILYNLGILAHASLLQVSFVLGVFFWLIRAVPLFLWLENHSVAKDAIFDVHISLFTSMIVPRPSFWTPTGALFWTR